MASRDGSTSDVWDVAAPSYDVQRSHDPVYVSCTALAVASTGRHGGTVLDAGCGTGLTTIPLLRRHDRVIALDYSFEALWRLAWKRGGRNVLRVRADMHNLPFRDGTFDAVLCANTLQHMRPGRSQAEVARELVRVARRKARVVVTVHHYSRDKQRLGWIKEGKPGQAGIDYIFRFTRADLAAIFPRARISAMGFRNAARIPRIAPPIQRVLARVIGRLAARRGSGHMLLARFRK